MDAVDQKKSWLLADITIWTAIWIIELAWIKFLAHVMICPILSWAAAFVLPPHQP